MKILARIISTGLGLGYFPKAPGTVGSLAPAIVFWLIPEISTVPFLLFCVFIFVIGVITSSITEKEFQKKTGDSTLHDPGIIVIDEIAGMLVALIALPKTLVIVIAAFILFRVFDIFKPFPVKNAQKLPAGWGIMADDVVAGVLSNVVLQICLLIFR